MRLSRSWNPSSVHLLDSMLHLQVVHDQPWCCRRRDDLLVTFHCMVTGLARMHDQKAKFCQAVHRSRSPEPILQMWIETVQLQRDR